jgi:hypothetical protein
MIRSTAINCRAFPAAISAAAVLLLCVSSLGARAETALEVQSWCKELVHAKIPADNRVFFKEDVYSGFCWDAFAVIQQFSRYTRNGTLLLGMCAPADSTRLQFIKIFSKYVDDHPETAHRSFADVARLSLTEAFRCPLEGNQ